MVKEVDHKFTSGSGGNDGGEPSTLWQSSYADRMPKSSPKGHEVAGSQETATPTDNTVARNDKPAVDPKYVKDAMDIAGNGNPEQAAAVLKGMFRTNDPGSVDKALTGFLNGRNDEIMAAVSNSGTTPETLQNYLNQNEGYMKALSMLGRPAAS